MSLTGKIGERLAAEYLSEKGYQLLCMNYRYKRYEIDLILQKAGTLIFVEVKTRSSAAFGYPEAFVDDKKAERVRAAAEAYIFASDWRGAIRFDLVSVLGKSEKEAEIVHFEDAF